MKTTALLIATALLASLVSCMAGGANDLLSGGDDNLESCQDAGNLIVNCGFDTDLSGWQSRLIGSGRHEANDGVSKPGCLEIEGVSTVSSYFHSFEQCIGITPNTTYDFGVVVRGVGAAPDFCFLFAHIQTVSDCSDGNAVSAPGGSFVPDTVWSASPTFQITTVAPGGLITGGRAVLLRASCTHSGPYTVRYDDFFFREAAVQP